MGERAEERARFIRQELPEMVVGEIDSRRHRYAYAIVWTPIPLITWILPFVGHMGISDSRGVIQDFAGPYYISVDEFGFGDPTRYLSLDPKHVEAPLGAGQSNQQVWDGAVDAASCKYERLMHNICCQNCHHHTADALNRMAYRGRRDWTQVQLATWLFCSGRYTGCGGCLWSWLPFLIILLIVFGFAFGLRAY